MKKTSQTNLRRTFLSRQLVALKWGKRKLFIKLKEAGINEDVRAFMEKVWSRRHQVSGYIYHVGKVIVYELYRFVRRHPGVAAAISVASAITLAAAKIPFVGPYIAPCVAYISFPTFGYLGLKADAAQKKNDLVKEFKELAEDFIEGVRNIVSAILGKEHKPGQSGGDNGLLPGLVSI